MSVDLFPTNPSPANAANTGATTSIGYKWRASVNGTCTGIKFHVQPASNINRDLGLYTNTGTLLASVIGGSWSTGWTSYAWATPVNIDAGVLYVAVIYSSVGDISASYTTMGSDRVSDVLTAPADNSGGEFNGVWAFSVGSMSLPANTDTTVSPTMFVSPVFEPRISRVLDLPGAAVVRGASW